MQYLLLHFGYAFLVLGLIIEGDATLVAAMILASQPGQPYFDYRWVLGIALAVTVGGNELLYEIGALGRMRSLMANSKHRQRVSGWLHSSRSGFSALLFSRFMWGFRLMIPFAAGVLHIKRRRFSFTNLFGALIWVAVLAYFGVAIQSLFGLLHSDLLRYQSHIAVALFLLGLVLGLGTIPWQITRRALRQKHARMLATAPAKKNPAAAPARRAASVLKPAAGSVPPPWLPHDARRPPREIR